MSKPQLYQSDESYNQGGRKASESQVSGSHSDIQDEEYQEEEEEESAGSDDYRHPEQELERQIIAQLKEGEVTGKFRDKICQDIEGKIEELQQGIYNKDEEQVLEVRSSQLAKSKILVMVHDRSPFRLVLAYTHLGLAYLDYQCFQQAEDHLTTALKRNKQHLEEIEKCKIYNAYILASLAKCFFQKEEYYLALDLLERARETELDFPDQEVSSMKTLMLISRCYSRTKDYPKAHKSIDQLIMMVSEQIGNQSVETALAYIQKARIYFLQEDSHEAESYQNKGIQTLIDINYSKPEFVAQAYQTLSKYLQRLDDVTGVIGSLQKAKTVFEQVYSKTDKRVIKLKREIAVVMLKNERFQEAIKQLTQTLELQKKTYGQNSVQVGKTMKIMGTIYLTMNEPELSQEYLRRSKRIFSDSKQPKRMAETTTKLKYVKQVRELRRATPKMLIRKV